jgi:hypothetical protein
MNSPQFAGVFGFKCGTAVRVEVYGRLDTTAQEFGDRLIGLVQAGRNAIVVDLKNIAYTAVLGFARFSLPIGPRSAAKASSRFVK